MEKNTKEELIKRCRRRLGINPSTGKDFRKNRLPHLKSETSINKNELVPPIARIWPEPEIEKDTQ